MPESVEVQLIRMRAQMVGMQLEIRCLKAALKRSDERTFEWFKESNKVIADLAERALPGFINPFPKTIDDDGTTIGELT